MARGARNIRLLGRDDGEYQYGSFGGQEWVPMPTKDDPDAGYWKSGADVRGDYYDDKAKFYYGREDTRIDYGQADQDYQRQLALGSQYQAAIDGTAPSVAQLQMQQGLDQATQQSINAAASARGGGALLAQQQAQQAAALGSQQLIGQTGQLRAQETAQARDAYAQFLGQQRAQSAQQAQEQAQTQLQSQQQRYAQAFGYRQQADTVRQSQRDANIAVQQGNQSAEVALATGQQQAAAAQRAAYANAFASAFGGGVGAAASYFGSGGKK